MALDIICLSLIRNFNRCSHFIIRTSLMLYFTNTLKWGDFEIFSILGGYSALIYILSFFHSYITDNYLGVKINLLLGNIFSLLGYCLLLTSFNYNYFFPNILEKQYICICFAIITHGDSIKAPIVQAIIGESKYKNGFFIFNISYNILHALNILLTTYFSNINMQYTLILIVLYSIISNLLTLRFIYHNNLLPIKKFNNQLYYLVLLICFSPILICIYYSLLINNIQLNLFMISLILFAKIYFFYLYYQNVQQSYNLLEIVYYSFIKIYITFFAFLIPPILILFINRYSNRCLFNLEIPILYFNFIDIITFIIILPIILYYLKSISRHNQLINKFIWLIPINIASIIFSFTFQIDNNINLFLLLLSFIINLLLCCLSIPTLNHILHHLTPSNIRNQLSGFIYLDIGISIFIAKITQQYILSLPSKEVFYKNIFFYLSSNLISNDVIFNSQEFIELYNKFSIDYYQQQFLILIISLITINLLIYIYHKIVLKNTQYNKETQFDK